MNITERILLAARYLDNDILSTLKENPDYDIDTLENGVTPLVEIIRDGRVDSVEFLIENGASVNWSSDDITPLTEGIMDNRFQVVKALINGGADVNLKTEYSSPILTACDKSNLAIIKLLVEAGAEVDTRATGNDDDSPLFRAIINGTNEVVQYLIDAGADLKQEGDANPVFTAVNASRDDMLDLILKGGGNPDVLDKHGSPSLDRAILESRISTAAVLLEHDANTNIATGHDGLLPLHRASMWGNVKLAELLLNHEADIHAHDIHGWSAMMYADFHYAEKIVELLKNAGASLPDTAHWQAISRINRGLVSDGKEAVAPLQDASDFFKSKALEAAIRGAGSPGIVSALLEMGCIADARTQKNEYLIDLAIMAHRSEIVDLLMKEKVSISRPGFLSNSSPLFLAVESGQIDMLKIVLAHVDLPANQDILDSAADIATTSNNLEMLNLLTDAGARTEDASSNFGPGIFSSNLVSVVTSGHHDMLRHLVAEGANLEEAGFLNMKPLHIAAEAGDLTAVQILVEGNADVNALSGMNKSPLCLATENGHVSVVQYLLEIGANTDSRGSRQKLSYSPLIFYAIYSGNLEMLKTLLAHGVELDVSDYFSSNSPLHSAILEGHVDMIEPLLEAGASIVAINRDSQTALELAEAIENKDAVRALTAAIQKKH